MLDRRTFLASAAAPLTFRGARRASSDTLLPWEGGPGYYRKWTNGPPADAAFFPISVWLQDPRNASRYKDIGINLYVGLWRGPTEAQLELLAAAGMPVLAAQTPVALESPHAALLRGWTLPDEPDNAQALPEGGYGSCVLPGQVADSARELRERDSARPVYLNLGQGVINPLYKGRGSFCSRHDEHYPQYIEAIDIVSYDIYPINYDLPMWYVGAGVRRLREWANYAKPVWNWIETGSIRGGPRPTPEQIEAQVWMSIINGSAGIGYFCHQFAPDPTESFPLRDTTTGAALASLNRRIAELAPVLNQPPVADGVVVESANPDLPIEWTLKRYDGKTYIFAIGVRPEAQSEVAFTLRDCGDLEARPLWESRAISVSGGVFRDSFTGYQPHIYELPFAP